jgi:predicted ATP-dependent Lon-type protease
MDTSSRLVERNYNFVELGPRGTGKSHLFQQVSPYAHLISGGKATVARMFVNMATGQRGLVCQYDVVCFDEIAGVSFDSKDGVNIMKGYMASGEFSRGKDSIRAEGGIVLVGNLDVDLDQAQRVGHLLSPLFKSEFRNTHWAISPGSTQNGAGLYRIEVSHQPGSGMRILNQPAPPAFRESVKVGEQVLFAQARSLVGDRDPRGQEFTLQLRAIDADKSGGGLGVPVLTALCGSLLGRNSRGGTIVVGSASLGGSVEMVANPVQLAELAIEKQAQTLLMPVSARRQLNDLPDELWTKISIEFYKDPADAVFKALVE